MKLSSSEQGLSLIEVLVAVLIIGLALATASQAISAWLRTHQRQTDVLRAQLCADNTLNELRLARQMPGIGVRTQACVQAGQTLQVRTEVSATPNPSFLRVDAQVYAQQQPVLRVSTILGRY
jgi:general secretion pathway protein I